MGTPSFPLPLSTEHKVQTFEKNNLSLRNKGGCPEKRPIIHFTKTYFKMKKLIINLFVFATIAIANSSFAATPTLDDLITLPAGTVVSLQLNQEVNSDEFFVGNSIDFMVRSNVTVNGKVLIAAGTFAEGTITAVKNSCDGQCPQITIKVDNVQAVDGQRINLNSKPHKVKAQCCEDCGNWGQQATIQMGTSISARVFDSIQVDG